MFAKIAKFRLASELQAAPSSVTLAHSNDNTMIARAARGPRRTRRPSLACHWRPMIGGGFECYWDIELADGAATEEPDQRLCISGLFGFPLAAGRLAVPVAG
jgi:hypothetical protein